MTTSVTASSDAIFQARRRTADRIFRGAVAFNAALTGFWLVSYATKTDAMFYRSYDVTPESIGRVAIGVLLFNVLWGFIWYGVKTLLLARMVGFSKTERRQAFASRMQAPFDVAPLVARYSERKIRIADMIGRRGRFMTLGAVGFFHLYGRQAADPSPAFAGAFLQDNLFDAVATGWIFVAFFYADNIVAAAMYGPQSRVMDGVLARANCLLITTLWSAFKFVMVPIGARLAVLYQPREFAAVFALIWGSYMACDAFAEIGGALFGRQSLRVWGVGDVNRKSIAGTVWGFAASFALCTSVVLAQSLPVSWLGLALVISVSNTALELWSPRGTDDFTMATTNALLCWGFGVLRS